MANLKKLIGWAIVVGILIVVGANWKTIRDRVVGFNQNAALGRDAKVFAEKVLGEVTASWNHDTLIGYTHPASMDRLSSADVKTQFVQWATTYGSMINFTGESDMKPGEGTVVDFDYAANVQFSAGSAKINLIVRKEKDEWKVVDFILKPNPAPSNP